MEHVLRELINTPKRITLRRCRCGIRFDVSTQGFPLILGSRTFEVNPRSGKWFCICERCRQKQAEFQERTKEHKKRVDAEYHAKEENKAKNLFLARERSEKKIQNANYKARPDVQERIREYIKDYKQRPEVQERIREYNNRPEVKEQRNTRQEYHTDIVKRCRLNLSRSLSKKIKAHLQGKYNGGPRLFHGHLCQAHRRPV